MPEHQASLNFDLPYDPVPAADTELRNEIAQAWGLPLGERVEVCFRGGPRASITGVLHLRSTPDYPWDPHQPLRLAIDGLEFGSREIERWTRL